MQVTVPPGVSPGMPFVVNTPAGQMQVICPNGASAGSPMLVNVPMAAATAAVPVVAATPVPVVGAAVVSTDVPMGKMPMEPVPMGITVPTPAAMSRGKMDGRVAEIESGCYTLSDCPCCYWMYVSVDVQTEQVRMGPCCCLPLGCCPCPIEWYKATAVGSSEFKTGSGECLAWQTPNTLKKHHPSFDPPEGTKMVKCC